MGLPASYLWPHQLSVTEEDRGVFAVSGEVWLALDTWPSGSSCQTGASTSTSLYFPSGALRNHHCDQNESSCVKGELIKAGMGMEVSLFDLFHQL